VLLYRGYSVEQIAEHGDFLETCSLISAASLSRATASSFFESSTPGIRDPGATPTAKEHIC
jgi:citrate synthase